MTAARQAPVPRRITRRSWLDPRVVGGIVLVIVAIVVGARVIGASSQTTAVWAAQRPLAAGTVLAADDLVAVQVNLGGSGPHYLSATEAPAGRLLSIPVGQGELLPSSALGGNAAGRVVVIPVSPDRMPPGIAHGSKIDLYLTVTAAAGVGAGPASQTRLIQSGITVQTVTAPAVGGLSGASGSRFQLAVLLDAGSADEMVRTLPTGEAIVVLVSGEGG